jgi:hypothetical protein
VENIIKALEALRVNENKSILEIVRRERFSS